MKTISRKLKISIERNLKSLIDKNYEEDTVKELLIDLREFLYEFMKSAKNRKTQNETFEQMFRDLRDVCDCIVHSNREKGIIEENIRNYVQKFIAALDAGNKTWNEIGQVDRLIHGDSLVCAMVGILNLFLLKAKSKMCKDQIILIFKDSADISLCIISLLQDTVIELKNRKDRAFLYVREREGTYRLYCYVFVSLTGKKRNQSIGLPYFSITFPVIITNAKNIDGLHFYEQDNEVNFATDWSLIKRRNDLPHVIETYRGDDKKLHVRFIDREI